MQANISYITIKQTNGATYFSLDLQHASECCENVGGERYIRIVSNSPRDTAIPQYAFVEYDGRKWFAKTEYKPQPQYNVAYQNGLMQPPKTCVDVRIKVNDQTIDLQKLPSEQSIADCNGMVVSENKDAIINEVAAMAKISQSVLDSMDRHRDIVERCNQLLEELNPEVKREAERTKEMNDLRNEVADLKDMLAQLLNSNKKGE